MQIDLEKSCLSIDEIREEQERIRRLQNPDEEFVLYCPRMSQQGAGGDGV